MRRFFSASEGNSDTFQVFSFVHILVLIIIGAILLSLMVFKKTFQKKAGFYRYFMAGFLFVLECSYQVWLVSAGKWNSKTTLPIELCEVTSIIAIIMLVTKSHFLFETVYFWGCLGSLLAVIFPDLHATYNHFRFWVFMLTHTLNLCTLTFMIAIIGYKPTLKSIGVSFMMMNVYMVSMSAINYFLSSNYYFYYVFRQPAPNMPGLLADVKSGFLKILILEGLIIFVFFICYLPFAVGNGLKKYFSRHPVG